jgi:hypothetical protein
MMLKTPDVVSFLYNLIKNAELSLIFTNYVSSVKEIFNTVKVSGIQHLASKFLQAS